MRQITNAPKFTRREMEIAAMLARGYKARVIAYDLFLHIKTVKNHLTSIYKKLGVSSRLDAVLTLMRNRRFLEDG